MRAKTNLNSKSIPSTEVRSTRTRNKLPSPPLVLEPVLAQARKGTGAAALLIELATFLESKALLTDGGRINLNEGLLGRKGLLSLTAQDVRSWAHYLALSLWSQKDPSQWPNTLSLYLLSYDRGKRRRPNRLQRLYLEWSSDYGPIGLLEAAQGHPELTAKIRAALLLIDEREPDSRLLTVFFETAKSKSGDCWLKAFQSSPELRKPLLRLLSFLHHPNIQERLHWLADKAIDPELHDLREELWMACARRATKECPIELPDPLFHLLLKLLAEAYEQIEAPWLAVLCGYRLSLEKLHLLESMLSSQDPIHRIAFGAGRSRLWWQELRAMLYAEAI